MPSRLPSDVRQRLQPIRLLILDVDGVLTDGSLHFGPDGEALKIFNVRDGLGLRLLMEAGIACGVISGRSSRAAEHRLRELGLAENMVVLGSKNKMEDLARLQKNAGEATDLETAVVGDDLPDLPMIMRAGFSACPGDAAPDVAAACDLVCGAGGGRGAVREVAELILKSQHRWSDCVRGWMALEENGGQG